MKKSHLFTALCLISASFFSGCTEPVPAQTKINEPAAASSMGENFLIDTKESVITWEGSMVFGFDEQHIGYVHLSKGELIIEKDQLLGGNAEIDMNTMEYGDKTNTNTPIKHLKSADYFDVEKFPVSTFVITRIEPVGGGNIKVTGKLTIKGVTNPISFPARVEIKDGVARANGKVIIDRTEWGIRYRSGKFYDKLADQTVADEISLQMKIVARK